MRGAGRHRPRSAPLPGPPSLGPPVSLPPGRLTHAISFDDLAVKQGRIVATSVDSLSFALPGVRIGDYFVDFLSKASLAYRKKENLKFGKRG